MNMEPEERMKNECGAMAEQLADLLLEPETASAEARTHLATCARCRTELEELRRTMNLLDSWEAPSPNPFFMTRMEARLREEREAGPAWFGARWMAGMRERLLMGAASHVRPLAAMALTAVLLVGGGTYLGVTDWDRQKAPEGQAASVVHDLQTMDNNAQLLDQLETMSTPADNAE